MSKREKTGNPKLAVAYIRVSTEKQDLGPEAQRAAIEKWASRRDVRVVGWYEDKGVSGAAPLAERPALMDAVAAIQFRRAGVFIAAKRDRIARDVVESGLIARAVRAAGAELRTADGVSDTATPEGEMLAAMMDVFAQYERAMIRARTKAALAAKKKRGERVGTLPYGHTVGADHRTKLIPELKEQKVMRLAAKLKSNGLSLRKIADELKRRGVVSARTGEPYGKSQVHAMLRSEAAV